MPRQNNVPCLFENRTLVLVILLNFRFVMWRSIAENDYTVAIHEIRLYIILIGESRLRLVRET